MGKLSCFCSCVFFSADLDYMHRSICASYEYSYIIVYVILYLVFRTCTLCCGGKEGKTVGHCLAFLVGMKVR